MLQSPSGRGSLFHGSAVCCAGPAVCGRYPVATSRWTWLRAALKKGQDLFLSTLEYRLLAAMATNRGQTLSRSRLLEEIWDAAGEFVNDNTLTVYIKRLREKIEDNPQDPRYIVTVRGAGYRML